MKIDMNKEHNHSRFNAHLGRIDCANDQGWFTVLFWDEMDETLEMSRHKSREATDKRFRALMNKAQSKNMCCRILSVDDTNGEIMSIDMTSYN